MYSDNKKNEFALLISDGVSYNSISQKLNFPLRILFRWAEDLSGVICDSKIAAFGSVTELLKVYSNKSILVNYTKYHSFVIFLSEIFKYIIVFSIPKISYMKSL